MVKHFLIPGMGLTTSCGKNVLITKNISVVRSLSNVTCKLCIKKTVKQ